MDEWGQAFLLGNAAIVGNVCMLPLYPGLLIVMAGRPAGTGAVHRRLLGLFVLAGVLTSTVLIGLVFFLVRAPVASAMPVLLPAVYVVVALLGVAMIVGLNPFARLAMSPPLLRHPSAAAFGYGAALAPLTLPCTGPLIVSAFVIGGVAGSGVLVQSLAYFLFFGLGFGWPLVILPLLAEPFQRSIIRWLAVHHRVVAVVSGVLLIGIAVLGFFTDLRTFL